MLLKGSEIVAAGPTADLPPELLAQATQTIDARGHIVIPGLVNPPHHMVQSLTRAIPAAQNAELFGWLRTLYPNGVRLDDSIAAAQEIGIRFMASRGSMSVGESAGGLPPDHLVERETTSCAPWAWPVAPYTTR